MKTSITRRYQLCRRRVYSHLHFPTRHLRCSECPREKLQRHRSLRSSPPPATPSLGVAAGPVCFTDDYCLRFALKAENPVLTQLTGFSPHSRNGDIKQRALKRLRRWLISVINLKAGTWKVAVSVRRKKINKNLPHIPQNIFLECVAMLVLDIVPAQGVYWQPSVWPWAGGDAAPICPFLPGRNDLCPAPLRIISFQLRSRMLALKEKKKKKAFEYCSHVCETGENNDKDFMCNINNEIITFEDVIRSFISLLVQISRKRDDKSLR